MQKWTAYAVEANSVRPVGCLQQLLATGNALWQASAFVSVALGCFICTSCVTIPESYKNAVSDTGIQINATQRFAGIIFVSTTAFVPGKITADTVPVERVNCSEGSLNATVLWADLSIARADGEQACNWILQATGYVARFASIKRFHSINYRLFLVPEGQMAEMRSFSMSPPGHLRPLYLAHWGSDVHSSKSGIVGLIAHEAVHLSLEIAGIHESRDMNEDIAYFAEACARLAIIGRVDASDYVAADPRSGPLPRDSHLGPSALASFESATTLSKWFSGASTIREDSQAGHELTNYCSIRLGEAFGGSAAHD